MHGDFGDRNIIDPMVKTGGFSDGSFLVIGYNLNGAMNRARCPLDLIEQLFGSNWWSYY